MRRRPPRSTRPDTLRPYTRLFRSGRCRAGAVAAALVMAEVAGFPDWDGDVAAARALQVELAAQVVLRDGYRQPPRTIAGFDVGFEDDGATTRAAAVLLEDRKRVV